MNETIIAPDGNVITAHSAVRLVAGNCPTCGAVVAVFNDMWAWPLVRCVCGWAGDTYKPLNKVRLEHVQIGGPA